MIQKVTWCDSIDSNDIRLYNVSGGHVIYKRVYVRSGHITLLIIRLALKLCIFLNRNQICNISIFRQVEATLAVIYGDIWR